MGVQIKSIAYHFPIKTLNNKDLSRDFPDWDEAKIFNKTGVNIRYIAENNETSLDLAYQAAIKLFQKNICQPNDIDFILFCTQTPDYFLPTSACILQEQLNIPTNAGALDFNLGCSGYVYGLAIAKGLIYTKQAKNVLLLTAETYSKFIAHDNMSVRTIFSDAAAATLITSDNSTQGLTIGESIFGTDGKGAKNLIVSGGGLRSPDVPPTLEMNGPKIFTFVSKTIPIAINQALNANKTQLHEVDLFIFHQANAYILEHLCKKIGIPQEKFVLSMSDCGNTVSSTIPIALERTYKSERIKPGMKILLVGFGVGYSWASTLLTAK